MSAEILVVEDNEVNLKLVTTILRLDGYSMQVARNADEAFALLDNDYIPDLILMDIQLPQVSGVEIIQKIRERNEFDNVIIVALTAYAMKGDEESFLVAGCDDYIAKPFNPSEFSEKIASLLASRS